MRRRPPHIPKPPDPVERHEPLPGAQLRPSAEDDTLASLQRAIIAHPSYLEADLDTSFLHSDVARGVRLQLDYCKAEQGLSLAGIERAIVVFGSTRLREPGVAQRELGTARQAMAHQPHHLPYQQQLKLAERRLELSRYYEVGRRLGQLVAQAGLGPQDSRVVVMTGGGPGAMEAANRGAHDVGARNVGLNITLPHEQYPNPYITPGLCFQFHYFALRKLHFMKRAAAVVALPGGFGTLDELFGTLTLIQTRKVPPMPIVLVGEAFWRSVFDVEFLLESGHIDQEDLDLFWYAESAQEVWEGILQWHHKNGTDLFPPEPTPSVA